MDKFLIMDLQQLKNEYILLLKRDTIWREDLEEMQKLREETFMEYLKHNPAEKDKEFVFTTKMRFKTQLLETHNHIKSSVNINFDVELPLAEYYIDECNFVVYTTSGIYSCMASELSYIQYCNIKNDNGDFIHEYYDVLHSSKSTPINIEIQLETKIGGFFSILIETSNPKKPLLRFLLNVISRCKN